MAAMQLPRTISTLAIVLSESMVSFPSFGFGVVLRVKGVTVDVFVLVSVLFVMVTASRYRERERRGKRLFITCYNYSMFSGCSG